MKKHPAPLQLSEIFYSFQGEGYHCGTPAVFIRSAGCNLKCDFCDTDFSLKLKLTPLQIYEKISEFPCKFVVITGGEAALQANGFKELTGILKDKGYYIALETNGDFTETLGVNWVTVSPKLSQKGTWKLKRGDELKLVYENQDLDRYLNSEFSHYFLQAKEIRTAPWGGGSRDRERSRIELLHTARAVLDNPPWKFSPQLHKEIGVP